MVETAQFNLAVERLMKTEHVITVFTSSRAGVFAFGETPKMTDRSMYSAITSMMLGAAEQMGIEMDEILDYVFLSMSERNLIVLGAGQKHLMGILTDTKVEPDKIARDARACFNEVSS